MRIDMNRESYGEIKRAVSDILKEYNIITGEDFDAMDEETGCVLYENLKAGVLEVFDVDEDDMNEILNELLGED